MSEIKKCNRTNIGGQAVLEGVMMRGSSSMAIAVRDEDGNVRLETERMKPLSEKPRIFRMPIIRGVISFFTSLTSGTKILMRSAEVYGEAEPSKFEKWLSEKFKIDVMSVIMTLSLVLGLGLAVGLFMWLPQFVTGLLGDWLFLDQTDFLFNLIEGLIKILVFVGYILLTSLMKDIRRTYMYHGAEHKTISCYECGLELTVENVKKCSRVHDRCGTTFMFFVMFISILVFSLANSFIQAEGILRIFLKICLLPVVAGLSYELLKALSKTDSKWVLPIKLPGMLLQRITTSEPDEDMIEVAITSFNAVLALEADPDLPTQKFVTAMPCDKLLEEIKSTLAEGGVEDSSDAEWILAISSGKKRSEILSLKTNLSPTVVEKARGYAKERASGRPLWYVVGDTDFYGLKIKVDEGVLIPRPETEELTYKSINAIKDGDRVLDLCTGSGCIAIAIKANKNCSVDAVDISEKALKTAEENAALHGLEINFILSDLFEKVEGEYDVIISNPPYIPTDDIKDLDKEVKREPILALDGGADGLDFYRRIAEGFSSRLKEGGKLFLECGIGQTKDIQNIFGGYKSTAYNDVNDIDRIVVIEK